MIDRELRTKKQGEDHAKAVIATAERSRFSIAKQLHAILGVTTEHFGSQGRAALCSAYYRRGYMDYVLAWADTRTPPVPQR